MLYVVPPLPMVVETAVTRGDFSTFDVSAQAAVITLKDGLPTYTLGAYITLGRQQPACEDEFEWVPSHVPSRWALWR